jgi:hypothetical protein
MASTTNEKSKSQGAMQAQAQTNVDEKMKRLTFGFPPYLYEALEYLADTKGQTLGQALCDAILFAQWAQQVRDQGGKVIFEENKKLFEVEIR